MTNEVLQKSLECSFNAFVKAEYTKRNFEYMSQDDAIWLKENWNLPLIELKYDFDDDFSILFLNDLISYHHKSVNNLYYQSIITSIYLHEYEIIINKYPEWIKRVYNISCQYKISFVDLCHPFNIEELLEKKTPDTKLHLPTFLETPTSTGFVGTQRINGKWVFVIDFTKETLNYKEIVNIFKEQLSIEFAYLSKDITPNIEQVITDIAKEDNRTETYENSRTSRLFGLAQWDHRLKYIDKNGNNIGEFKRNLRLLNWTYCKSDCKSDNKEFSCQNREACKKALKRQLQGTIQSIENKKCVAMVEAGCTMPKKAKKIFERTSMPDITKNYALCVCHL